RFGARTAPRTSPARTGSSTAGSRRFFPNADELEQPGRVCRRGRLVLVAEVDVRRRARLRGKLAQVVVGVRRLAHADVAERLRVEVVHAHDAVDAGPRLVPEVERELELGIDGPEHIREESVVARALHGDADRP